MAMETHYLSIYRLPGVIGLPDNADVTIIPAGSDGARAILTLQKDEYILHLRRRAALGMMMPAAMFALSGSQEPSQRVTPTERFHAAFARAQVNDGTGEVLLVIEVIDRVQSPSLGHLIDVGEIGARIEIFDDEPLAIRAEKALRTAFAGLSLALPDHTTDSMVMMGSAAFAIEPDTDRLLYSLKIQASASMTSATNLGRDAAQNAAAMAQALQSTTDLQNTVRLLSQSSKGHIDQLMAFLSAWTALELFIQQAFKSTYEPRLHALFEKAAPSSASRFLERMRDVMNDKYNIRDKFVAVASALDEVGAEADIVHFAQLKKRRDDFAHAMKDDPTTLPADATRDLLRKYLRLHLRGDTLINRVAT